MIVHCWTNFSTFLSLVIYHLSMALMSSYMLWCHHKLFPSLLKVVTTSTWRFKDLSLPSAALHIQRAHVPLQVFWNIHYHLQPSSFDSPLSISCPILFWLNIHVTFFLFPKLTGDLRGPLRGPLGTHSSQRFSEPQIQIIKSPESEVTEN